MTPWECFSSAICLEGWQRTIRLIGLSFGVLATIFAFCAAMIAFFIPAFIESRISTLTAPRHLTDAQNKSLLVQLNNFKSYSAYFYAHVASEESQTYAGELLAIFHQAGWITHGPVLYSTDEVPPQGVAIEVINTSKPMPDELATFNALKSIGVEKLVYFAIPKLADARKLTNSVTIRIGVRPKS